MRTVRTTVVLAVALTIAFPAIAAAEKGKKKEPLSPAAQRIERVVAGLTLTDDQKAKLDTLKKEFDPKLTEAMKKTDVLTPEQKKAREAAAKAANAAGKTKKEINQAVAAAVTLTAQQKGQQAEAKKQMSTLERELREGVMAALTAEQKEQLKTKPKERKKPGK